MCFSYRPVKSIVDELCRIGVSHVEMQESVKNERWEGFLCQKKKNLSAGTFPANGSQQALRLHGAGD